MKIADMEMCVCCVLRVRMNVSMSKLLKARPAAVNADLIRTNKPPCTDTIFPLAALTHML